MSAEEGALLNACWRVQTGKLAAAPQSRWMGRTQQTHAQSPWAALQQSPQSSPACEVHHWGMHAVLTLCLMQQEFVHRGLMVALGDGCQSITFL